MLGNVSYVESKFNTYSDKLYKRYQEWFTALHFPYYNN